MESIRCEIDIKKYGGMVRFGFIQHEGGDWLYLNDCYKLVRLTCRPSDVACELRRIVRYILSNVSS